MYVVLLLEEEYYIQDPRWRLLSLFLEDFPLTRRTPPIMLIRAPDADLSFGTGFPCALKGTPVCD